MNLRALALLALASCGPTVSVVPLNPSPRPFVARHPSSVLIYTTHWPEHRFAEVAVLTGTGGTADQHYGAIRTRAAELGCDAVVFTASPRDASTSGVGRGGYVHGSTNSGSSATCIMWLDARTTPSASATSMPPPEDLPR